MRLTVDLSQGHRVDEVDERFLLFHLGLPVPPLQVPEEQGVLCHFLKVLVQTCFFSYGEHSVAPRTASKGPQSFSSLCFGVNYF